ncbi:hypothetical protein [Psychrobacter sp. BI730]|uniref:hypothetical protein n=1 Tax=Psychrobacter sp. BI730 TaxID=2705463 RepID=UPI0015C6F11A|nr:hypothetical protein [Psychrobacter sp. BI730]NYR08825.1 hypothetical protein [Psychrobacter sp. BI730]
MSNDYNIVDNINILNDPKIDVITKNSIAISLSETADKRVLYCLHDLIKNPLYKNMRGTFVYCLRSFPSEGSFSLAIELVLTGNFEVAHEAFEILDNVKEKIDQEVVRASYDKVSTFYENNSEYEEWRKFLIEDLMSMFD